MSGSEQDRNERGTTSKVQNRENWESFFSFDPQCQEIVSNKKAGMRLKLISK